MNEAFQKDGYLVVPNYLSRELVLFISHYFFLSVDAGLGKFGDSQAPNSRAFYADPSAETLLQLGTQTISHIIGEEVLPTYSYTRIYGNGDELVIHRDRPSCEISLTVSLAIPESYSPSPLFFSKTEDKKDTKQVILNPGDACIYKGCEMYHWREKFTEHPWYLQTFLHYVRKNGPYSNYKFDQRPVLGVQRQ